MADTNNTRVSIEALSEAITTFDNKKMAMENAYLKIYRSVGELGDSWIGSSSQKFNDKFEQMYKNLETVSNQVDTAVQKIRLAIQEYEATEEATQSAINALEQGDTSYF